MTRFYLAGPMRGIPLFNFPAFRSAADALRCLGHEVVSPAEEDLSEGFEPTLDMDTSASSEDFTLDDYHAAMRRDIAAILTVDAIATLPGWEESQGALVEVAVAKAIGIPVRSVVDVVSDG